MEAASTSETSVNFYQTTKRNNPEDSHIHTRCSEKLKFQIVNIILDIVQCLMYILYRSTLRLGNWRLSRLRVPGFHYTDRILLLPHL
jgi:hypothetical protein